MKTMEKINVTCIEQLVHGVARIEECEGTISFHRFTKEQQELYQSVSNDFYMKSFSTSGVSLEFDTDSEKLGLSVEISKGSSRTFFTHSIFVNGERIGELSGEIEDAIENTQFCKEFRLGIGMKRVRILFPWSVASKLVALELEKGAIMKPVTKECTMIMFGDSITQGYDAMLPEHAYAVQIADFMNADVRNKGIGGEQFRAELALLTDGINPDVITVAYGTNDWAHSTKEVFERLCKEFYHNLRATYPKTNIIALTPIWRTDICENKEFGASLYYVAEYIKKVAEDIPNMTVIDCMDYVPHSPQYYQTDGVHPIDVGFQSYGKSLCNKIRFL